MATYDWPAYASDKAFWPETVELKEWHNNIAHESELSGDIQTNSTPGARWGIVLNFPRQTWLERARLHAFLTRLSGMQHRVRLFDPHKPLPAGTINTSGVTVNASAAQFATSLQLTGCGATKTLFGNDWFAIAGQLLKAVVLGTSDGSGLMTIEFRHPLRAAISAGAAVTLSSPTALYILLTREFGLPYGASSMAPPTSIEFREVFV